MAARERLLLVDGYNVLGAWIDATRGRTIDEARDYLIRRLHDYAGFTGQQVVLVFDAYQSDRTTRTEETHGSFTVVYTQKGELADHYIERVCDQRAHEVEVGKLEIRVATSDALEQTVVLGRGATRMSARELIYEMGQTQQDGAPYAPGPARVSRSTVMDHLPEDVRRKLEKMRRGEN